jgi:hypothetical protein
MQSRNGNGMAERNGKLPDRQIGKASLSQERKMWVEAAAPENQSQVRLVFGLASPG